jgi:hypothetical protein
VLVNHFKSQSGGGGPKRARQAQGVRDIVDRLIDAGETNIIVVGDFNEGPAAGTEHPANLEPLFAAGGPLVSIYTLPVFDPGPRPGTFQSSTLRNRLDYILVSHALAPLVRGGGVERRGLWGTPTNVNPRPRGHRGRAQEALHGHGPHVGALCGTRALARLAQDAVRDEVDLGEAAMTACGATVGQPALVGVQADGSDREAENGGGLATVEVGAHPTPSAPGGRG